MKIITFSHTTATLYSQNKNNKNKNIMFKGNENENLDSLDLYANYNKPIICRIAKK